MKKIKIFSNGLEVKLSISNVYQSERSLVIDFKKISVKNIVKCNPFFNFPFPDFEVSLNGDFFTKIKLKKTDSQYFSDGKMKLKCFFEVN